MPRRSAKIPRFKSEAEEASWYATPQGRRQTQLEFASALRSGKLKRSWGLKLPSTDRRILEQLMEQAKERATRPISLRIPIADLERAKQIAEQTGTGYQTVLKEAIRKGLKRAG